MPNKLVSFSSLKKERTRLQDVLPLSMPIVINIDPTNYCNFHCLYCPRSLPEYCQYVGKYVHLDITLFERIIKEIVAHGRPRILRLYYLGEPFLHPQILEMISLAMRNNVAERIEITSNGSVVNAEQAEGICSIAKTVNVPLYLRFSIYSVDQEKHIRITNSKIDIENIYHNIEYLKKCRDNSGAANVFIYAKMIDTLIPKENDTFLKRYSSIVDEVAIEPPQNWSGFNDIDLLSNVYETTVTQSGTISSHRRVCAYPFYTLCINSDGTVVACCVDWSRKTLLGNIKEQTFYEIWNGSPINNLRELHLRGERVKNEACKYCEILHSQPIEDDLDSLSVEKWNELNMKVENIYEK